MILEHIFKFICYNRRGLMFERVHKPRFSRKLNIQIRIKLLKRREIRSTNSTEIEEGKDDFKLNIFEIIFDCHSFGKLHGFVSVRN